MSIKAIAGIGSRKTPLPVLQEMCRIGRLLSPRFTLRSGGAKGADSAFEEGLDLGKGQKNIFLPFEGFNGRRSEDYGLRGYTRYVEPSELMVKMTLEIHPNPGALRGNPEMLAMHARNLLQVLGEDLVSHSVAVIVYTDFGEFCGGSGQALRIAQLYKIPIFNYGLTEDITGMTVKIIQHLNTIK